jgi:addiction module HigA family antidote
MRERRRPPTHPGGILLRHYLAPLGLSVAQAALALGVSRAILATFLEERSAVTPDMALRLARAFQTTPAFWGNLQRTYDRWYAAHH